MQMIRDLECLLRKVRKRETILTKDVSMFNPLTKVEAKLCLNTCDQIL